MRTRLYGGVAGERGIFIPRPYADENIRWPEELIERVVLNK
jgi:hypothetical protein